MMADEDRNHAAAASPMSASGNLAAAPYSNGSLNGARMEMIAGCVGMVRNFTGNDPLYGAEMFF